jgi:hypothetical protein
MLFLNNNNHNLFQINTLLILLALYEVFMKIKIKEETITHYIRFYLNITQN